MEHIMAFLVYSYLGATLEHISYFMGSFQNGAVKSLGNPIITGFPIYGMGAYFIVVANRLMSDYILPAKFLAFGAILTIFEYLVGLYVGAGPKSYKADGSIDAWDYSSERCNIDGIISLRHFISWGTLGLAISIFHPELIKIIKFGIKN